jgi:hypothetical protein
MGWTGMPRMPRKPRNPRGAPEYYCPGCGRRWKFLTECRGQSAAAPHQPILVVDTAELDGDPADFTPAPASLGE